MRYLGLALFGEGSTDYQFLSPILRRATEEMCLKQAKTSVEIGEVLPLVAPSKYKNSDLTTKIVEAAKLAQGAFDILFIHTDGGGDPVTAYDQRVKPAALTLNTELSSATERVVGVVPVREMEAWTLVDGNALRATFGTVLDNKALGIPSSPREVERIYDPKLVFNEAYDKVVGQSRRRKTNVTSFLNAIGERIDLNQLRQVLAYQRFEMELYQALFEIGYFS